MILNRDELEKAIKEKISTPENILMTTEAHLQNPKGPELEGLLVLTNARLLFAYTPPFEKPRVLEFDRETFSITAHQEDIWGASVKFQCGAESGEFRRLPPSDFKTMLAQLGEKAPQPSSPPPTSSIFEKSKTPNTPPQSPLAEPEVKHKKVEIIAEGKCYIHPDKDELTKCDECLKPICSDCINPHRFKTYCPTCFEKIKASEKEKAPKEEKISYPTSYTQISDEPHRVKVEIKSERKPLTTPKKAVKNEARSPALAFLFSFMPGFGQFYNKQIGKGFLVMLTSPLIIPWIWGFVDAVKEAKKHNQSLGITAQPAGCFAFLLTVFPILFVFFLTIGFMETEKEMEKQLKNQEAQLAQLGVIPTSELEERRTKIQEILQKIYQAQMEYFKTHKEFMDEIPQEIIDANDSGYRLELFMLGSEGKRDFRVIAWAEVGEERKLDLWSVGSGGFIAHEYPALVQ